MNEKRMKKTMGYIEEREIDALVLRGRKEKGREGEKNDNEKDLGGGSSYRHLEA